LTSSKQRFIFVVRLVVARGDVVVMWALPADGVVHRQRLALATDTAEPFALAMEWNNALTTEGVVGDWWLALTADQPVDWRWHQHGAGRIHRCNFAIFSGAQCALDTIAVGSSGIPSLDGALAASCQAEVWAFSGLGDVATELASGALVPDFVLTTASVGLIRH